MTKYEISTSQDGINFERVSCGGIACQFDGNYDRHTLVGNDMPSGLTALVIRLYPIEWSGGVGLRWAVCGKNTSD